MNAVEWARELRVWRGKRAQKEAAAALGVPWDTYRGWEYARHLPPPFTLDLLREKMAMTMEEKAIEKA